MNDYNLYMEKLYIILGVIFTPVLLLILIEYIVERLPEDNRFVKWWRRHVVSVIDVDDELF